MAAVYRHFRSDFSTAQDPSQVKVLRGSWGACVQQSGFVICRRMQYKEVRIEVAEQVAEHVTALLCERFLPFQECDQGTLESPPVGRTRFQLYLDEAQAASVDELLAEVHKAAGPTAVSVERRDRDENEWRDTWKQYFATRRIGRFAIVPSWERAAHTPKPDEVTLFLDPGRAFGTGGHASTRLCLQLLSNLTQHQAAQAVLSRLSAAKAAETHGPGPCPDPIPETILDVGCGCGILALAALGMFPGARGVAIDLDPEAVEVTRENIVSNGLNHRLRATTERLARLQGKYALVFANLTGPTLAQVCAGLSAHTEKGGLLIASGLLSSEADALIEAFETRGFGLLEHARAADENAAAAPHGSPAGCDPWSGLLFQKRA